MQKTHAIAMIVLMMFCGDVFASDAQEITFCAGKRMMNLFYSKIYQQDQGLRSELAKILKSKKKQNNKKSALKLDEVTDQMIIDDISHQIVLNQLIKDCGWPARDEKTFEQGSAIAAAYFVIQHAQSLEYQLRYCPQLVESHRSGDIPDLYFEYYVKRVLKHEDNSANSYLQSRINEFVNKNKLSGADLCQQFNPYLKLKEPN